MWKNCIIVAIQRLLLEQNLELSSSFDIKYQEEIYKRQFREIYVRKEQILPQWQMQRPAIQFELSTTYCPTSFVSMWWKSRVKSRHSSRSLLLRVGKRLFSTLDSKMNLLLFDKNKIKFENVFLKYNSHIRNIIVR